jgi:hypothetical protein
LRPIGLYIFLKYGLLKEKKIIFLRLSALEEIILLRRLRSAFLKNFPLKSYLPLCGLIIYYSESGAALKKKKKPQYLKM